MAEDIADFHRGDTKKYKFTFDDGAATPTPIDITGWQIWSTLKLDPTSLDADAAMQVSTTAGDQLGDDPVNGIMYLVFSSLDTAIAVETYYYDFQRVIAGTPPDVKTLKSGKVKILEDVTKDDA